ncbi:hypothetical protein P691DRAFT_40984 [Macrolepiota fuliginosa MF-IS2]|uniref:Cation-transporting P-type ATPase N-terminal domain-containing protein n=1 Tax=Macrolepiota fuliginosa MF-IS2 TaxID=1400762 RepID=A0A9P6C6A9_9AGAR|nr:hypothetical protein P691DRAFT_40984 [Macrolepiota fuliginosa MF-IS2]
MEEAKGGDGRSFPNSPLSLSMTDEDSSIPSINITDATSSAHQPELLRDDDIDPTPFAFEPCTLAHMLDPKTIEAPAAPTLMLSVLRGLGADPKRGLSADHLTGLDMVKSTASARLESDPPTIVLTEPSGLIREPSSTKDPPTHYTTFEGQDTWPHRPSKSLLALMWLAMKDKVLILLSIAVVISLALGLFQDSDTPREPGLPPIDWVEGVAIMIAVTIVLVGSLNDWQKERQFRKLNEKEGVQECIKSSATKGSDTIKNVSNDEFLELSKASGIARGLATMMKVPKRTWATLTTLGKSIVGAFPEVKSLRTVVCSSSFNIMLVFIPISVSCRSG